MTPVSHPPTNGMDQNVPIDDDATSRGRPPRKRDRDNDRARDAELVGRARRGDPDAFGLLYDVWFDRLHDVARRIVHDDQVAAEITQDAFLAAWRKLDTLADPASFGGWVLRIARNAALNRRVREQRATAVDAEGFAMIERDGASPVSAPAGFGVEDRASRLDDPASVVGDAELVGLVHEAASALSERDAEVLRLQLRYELTPAEVGEVLGISRNAANQTCHRVRERFARAFGARLLWRGGTPRCAALQAELAVAGHGGFDATVVRLTSAHAEACAECGEERRSRLTPSALFGAIGVVPALAATKQAVARGLAAQGVPMGGSAAVGGSSGVGSPSGDGTTPTGPTAPTGATVDGDASTVPVQPPPPPDSDLVIGPGGSGRGLRHWPPVAQWGTLAAGVVLVVVLLALVVGQRDAPRPDRLGSGRTAPTGSSVASNTLARQAPAGRPVAEPGDPTGATSTLVAGSGTVAPGTGATTPTVPPTSAPDGDPTRTAVPAPVVERFDVAPAVDQPAVWSMATGPVLTWSVTGAVDVTIHQYFDDGVGGDRRQGIVATGSSGSVRLCPGSPVAGADDGCSAPAGRYSYELVATAPAGSMLMVPDRPGFTVLPPVIR